MSAICMFLVLSSFCSINRGLRHVAYTGVQRNTSISALLGNGCTICYDAKYGSETKSDDITSCSGPFLFVGVQTNDASVMEIGAISSAEVVLSEKSRENLVFSNGIYWHFAKGQSFGFTAEENDSIASADMMGENLETSKTYIGSKVLWRLDHVNGSTYNHQREIFTMWRKNIYNCPHLSCE